MATCYPNYSESDRASIKSAAEWAFYFACQASLPRGYHVFHSVGWITRSSAGAHDGETDFLVCHPDLGLLTIEVKGGGIRVEGDRWTSTDRHGREHPIKDPVRQAREAKYRILEKLKEHPSWPGLHLGRLRIGHAAMFPDIETSERLSGPDAPRELLGDARDVGRLEDWIETVFAYWHAESDASRARPPGSKGIKLMRDVFARVVEARPLLAGRLRRAEEERIRLTQRQVDLLDALSRQRRVAISGGAGTGKTVLAATQARRLASQGFNTLLTCYNRPLGDHLAEASRGQDNLTATNFHRVCQRLVGQANERSQRNLFEEAEEEYRSFHPNLTTADRFEHVYPQALVSALDVLDERYGAIVVDEGQDFRQEAWTALGLLLRDVDGGPFVVFHDENQDVYGGAGDFPVPTSPIVLTRNCRNTRPIHDVAYRYYRGEPTKAHLEGADVAVLDAPDVERQARKIVGRVTDLLVREQVPASAVAILIAGRLHRSDYEQALDRLADRLPKPHRWGKVDQPEDDGITVETVARFKGLEGQIVFLWGLDHLADEERHETLYIGSTRATAQLYLCGSSEACEAVLGGK